MLKGSKQLVFGTAARTGLLCGINQLGDAVASTLGPKGRNVVITQPFGAPHITKDGVSVAKVIELSDALENAGAQMVKEVAMKAAENAGDGTTTATVLAQAIAQNGIDQLENFGHSAIDINRGIQIAMRQAVELIKQQAIPCDTPQDVYNVAFISSNGDEVIAQNIADAVTKVGKEGIVSIVEGRRMDDTLEVVDGLQFSNGYISPYLMNNPERQSCELQDAFILVTDHHIVDLGEIATILDWSVKDKKEILVIADDFSHEALAVLASNVHRGVLRVCAVKAPGFGDRRQEILKDIAALVGAQFISKELIPDLQSVTLNDLGRAANVTVLKASTTISGGDGNQEEIEARAAAVRTRMAENLTDYDKDKLAERLAMLTGSVGLITVGGLSELEVKEKKDRYDDALHATRAALTEGVVAGGGIALLRISRQLFTDLDEGAEWTLALKQQAQKVGAGIAADAMTRPFGKIIENIGLDLNEITARLDDNPDADDQWGFDARNEVFCNMVTAGIIDPALVTRSAIEAAASVGGLILTSECVIIDAPKESTIPELGSMGALGRG